MTETKTVQYALKKIPTDLEVVKVKEADTAIDYARELYGDDIAVYESMWLLLLNRANIIVGHVKISQGGTYGTVYDVKLVTKYAIDTLASSVIMVHNHPSGVKEPSEADKKITRNTKKALKLFDITLLDHLILTENDCFCFADTKLI